MYLVQGSGEYFFISNGTIYGSDTSDSSLINTATNGAAFCTGDNGGVGYGTIDENGYPVYADDLLYTTNDTIKVVNGVLQE